MTTTIRNRIGLALVDLALWMQRRRLPGWGAALSWGATLGSYGHVPAEDMREWNDDGDEW